MLTSKQLNALRRSKAAGRNRILTAMEILGLTQVQVAEKTGFTQPYVSRVANGRYEDLPGETMRTFATLFGCAIEDLFPARQAVA